MMASILKPLVITPMGGEYWALVDDLKVRLSNGTTITVLKGFVSDGESGPLLLKDILIKPNTYRQTAAFVHDALYENGMDKDWSDNVYAEILRSLGIDKDDEEELYEAVHLFGWSGYKTDNADLTKKAMATQYLRITFSN